MRFGFTIVWVGWEFDVGDRPNAMRIQVPIATDHGSPITGVVRATFTANSATKETVVGDLGAYPSIDPDGADSQLAVRSAWLGGHADTIPHGRWRLKGHTVTFDSGFVPGKTYEISYRAANPPVAGLGFVAVRDTTAWLKHRTDAVANVRYAYGYGSSQSGRFLRSFLYEGFNTDEHDRQVFDGDSARRSLGDVVSVRRCAPARSGQRRRRRNARQPAYCGPCAESLLHEHFGRILGNGPRGGVDPHEPGRKG